MRNFVILTFALAFALASATAALELPPGLGERVEQLLADIESDPTTAETLVDRSRVLWEWANHLSLQGTYVPKMLPVIVARAPAPRPGTEVPASYAESVDQWARQLAALQRDPRAFGHAEIEDAGPFGVDSFQTLTTTLEVGSLGIQEGGGILVSQHIGTSMGRLQTSDPRASHYLSVETSRAGARLERSQAPVVGPYGGFRGAVMFPKWIVRGTPLRPGDTVTITYGDVRGGGPGVQMGTYSNDALALPLFVDPGDGVDYELEAPTFAIEGGPVSGVHGFAPSVVAVGETVEISVRSEDLYYNRATGDIPAYEVTLDGLPYGEIEASPASSNGAIHLLRATLDRPGVHRFRFESRDGRVAGVANPIWVRENAQHRIYWGETHGHCGFAEGSGTPEGYYRFASEDARLDFATLSEHDIWMTDAEWKVLNDVSGDFREQGNLITYPGYEWTTDRARGGHHNVLFRRIGMERVPTQVAPDLSDLYRVLHQTHPPEDVLVIPHAHQAGDWRLGDLPMERLIEIMSGHGTFEWFGNQYLQNGWRVGFIGASDDHLGHPGYAAGAQRRDARNRGNIFQFGGLAGVWASERSPDALFEAMRARSAYAVTGSQRILLEATLNGAEMGTEVSEDPAGERRRELQGRVIGTAPIQTIDLVKNGNTVANVAGFEAGSVDPATETVRLVVSFFSDSVVFFRDNPRGHRPWQGTMTVDGATVEAVQMLGTLSPLHDQAELEDGVVTFSVATRGSARTLLLELSGVTPNARLGFALQASQERGRAPTVVRPSAKFDPASFSLPVPSDANEGRHELIEGRYLDVVSVQRADRPRDDIEFHFEDVGEPGDYYYLRIVQIDGHRAWSSPWWVGGEAPR